MNSARLAPLVTAMAVLSVAAIAHAQEWSPVARQCSAEIGEQAGHWPEWSRCVIARVYPKTDPGRVSACIHKVEEIREREQACNMCGDPVADVVRCAEGQP